MSSESDSDVFFDAEEVTPVKTTKSVKKDEKNEETNKLDEESPKDEHVTNNAMINISDMIINEDLKEAARKARDNEQRRKKVEELRKQMLHDDDDVPEIHSEQSSIESSSVEGIYPSSSRGYAYKHSDRNSNETSSVMSLGKIGSILGGRDKQSSRDIDTVSTDSKYSCNESGSLQDGAGPSLRQRSNCTEPDVVASTKGEFKHPVAPPRRKKRNKNKTDTNNLTVSESNVELPSPTDPVESLAREIEFSLDLHSATRGQYVVKPQDREQDRAEGPNVENAERRGSASQRSDSLKSNSSKNLLNASEGHENANGSNEESKQQQPYMVRTRSDSGRPLTDQEILAQVTVRNLDTGEQIPLSLAEEHLPRCLNPLSLHIMRLTSEYVSNTALNKESDEESTDMRKSDSMDIASRALERTRGLGRRLRMEVSRIRTVVDKVTHSRHGDEDNSEEEIISDQRSSVKIKSSSKLKSAEKGGSEFENIRVVQELSGEHTGAIWTMKFSTCGRLLATAGQDHDLRIWVLRDAYKYFDDMRQRFNAESGKTSPQPDVSTTDDDDKEESEDDKGPFLRKPFCTYQGHTAELLDVSWSKNYFILSSSMDKTVRLWHISRKECLCCFQHIDFVTAIVFHPKDDRYFLSGSLDGKLRLWNIPDKKVTLWNELDGQTKLITAVNFCQNGKIAVVGSYDGRCIFYYTDQLKYYTQIHVRSTKGKNSHGRKISGIEEMPGEDKILVTSNDSRIRLYDLRDLCLTCKYKGYVNLSSQIKASLSHDGKYILSGSENQFIYLWKTSHDYAKFRRDRNDYWTAIKAHNAVVTSAVFAPNPSIIVKQLIRDQDEDVAAAMKEDINKYYIMVSGDFNGAYITDVHEDEVTVAFENDWQPESKFPFNRVRLPPAPPKDDKPISMIEGQEVEVFSRANEQEACGWWRAVVKMTKGDFHVVEYLGWETTYTEIVPSDRLRLKNTKNFYTTLNTSHLWQTLVFFFQTSLFFHILAKLHSLYEDIFQIRNGGQKNLKKTIGVLGCKYNQDKKCLQIIGRHEGLKKRACMLSDMHFRNLRQKVLLLNRTEEAARQLESTRLHSNSGYGEEFTVREDLMGLAIGAHGANIQNARKLEGITGIDLEECSCTFKIFGEEGRGPPQHRTGKGSMDMQVHRKPTSHPSLTDRTSGHMVEGSVTERTFSVPFVFVGTIESITNAKILLEYHLAHLKEVEKLRQEKLEIDQQLRSQVGNVQNFPVPRRPGPERNYNSENDTGRVRGGGPPRGRGRGGGSGPVRRWANDSSRFNNSTSNHPSSTLSDFIGNADKRGGHNSYRGGISRGRERGGGDNSSRGLPNRK
ncbi:WD repeat-containing protein 44 [Argiope bruennichi]|uniref:WD repeat-containing protein 44 n=1 Tax=Argiope bruennichi TaxID=94029 RepID=A0A8T0E576_ARGBR|nr:WD repeat-containing protein 44 [Argiope bruennichi]